LSESEQADVDAINNTLPMLRDTIAASPDERAKAVLKEAYFQYWPSYDGGIAAAARTSYDVPIKRNHVITFFSGFSDLADPNNKDWSKSYSYSINRRGPTYALFLAAHEIGHGVLGHDGAVHDLSKEYDTHRYARGLIKYYPGNLDDFYRCYDHC
jgi:hypothetical protein